MTHNDFLATFPGFTLVGNSISRKQYAVAMFATREEANALVASSTQAITDLSCQVRVRAIDANRLRGPGLPTRIEYWVELRCATFRQGILYNR